MGMRWSGVVVVGALGGHPVYLQLRSVSKDDINVGRRSPGSDEFAVCSDKSVLRKWTEVVV